MKIKLSSKDKIKGLIKDLRKVIVLLTELKSAGINNSRNLLMK